MSHRDDIAFSSTFQNSQDTFSSEQMNRLMGILKEHNRLNMILLSEGYRPILMPPTSSLSPSPSACLDSESNLALIRSRSTNNIKRIPRPNNSFMTYRKDKQKSILDAHPGINNKEVSKIVGEMWRNESEDVKIYYRKKAEEGKREHALRYPGYKYTPRKRQRRAHFSEELVSPQQMKNDFLSFTNITDNYPLLPNCYGSPPAIIKPSQQLSFGSDPWNHSLGPSVTNFLCHPAAVHDTNLMENGPGCYDECWNVDDPTLSPQDVNFQRPTINLSEQDGFCDFLCFVNSKSMNEFTPQLDIKSSTSTTQLDDLSEPQQESFNSYEMPTRSSPQSPNPSNGPKVSIFEANIQQFENYLNEVLGPYATRD